MAVFQDTPFPAKAQLSWYKNVYSGFFGAKNYGGGVKTGAPVI